MLKDFSVFKSSELSLDSRLPEGGVAVIRLDGSNFSKLTTQFEKPFSVPFEHAMNAAAIAVFKQVLPSALLVYVASDEISLVVSDSVAELPYGRRIQKLVSIAASTASVAFMRSIPDVAGTPAFDGRVLALSEPELIREYVTWRRLDCRKNATSMAAGHLKSHKELLGVSTRERGDILVGSAFENIPEGTFNGRFIAREERSIATTPATRELTEELCATAAASHSLLAKKL